MTSEQRKDRTQAARQASIRARQLRYQRRLADELRAVGWVCLRDAHVVETTGAEDHVLYLVWQDTK
jgi:hypothetical protein